MSKKEDIKNMLIENGLHELNGSNVVVVEPIEIAKKFNIDVKVGDTSKVGEGGMMVSGFIGYNQPNHTFYIGLSEKDGYSRQRFTLAHELGHYFLHKDYLIQEGSIIDSRDNILFRVTNPNDQKEKEANNFAAEYLMPEVEVRSAWNRFPYASLIAPYFKVSELAMAYRLVNLGITNG